MYIDAYIYAYIYIYVYIHICMYIFISSHTHMPRSRCPCMYAYPPTYEHDCMHIVIGANHQSQPKARQATQRHTDTLQRPSGEPQVPAGPPRDQPSGFHKQVLLAIAEAHTLYPLEPNLGTPQPPLGTPSISSCTYMYIHICTPSHRQVRPLDLSQACWHISPYTT